VIKSHAVGTIQQYIEWLILNDRVQPPLLAGVHKAYPTGRGVGVAAATKGYLYVYTHTVYKYPFTAGVIHNLRHNDAGGV
jgi:hypothetical protein